MSCFILLSTHVIVVSYILCYRIGVEKFLSLQMTLSTFDLSNQSFCSEMRFTELLKNKGFGQMRTKLVALLLLCAIGTITHASDLKQIIGEENYSQFQNNTLEELDLDNNQVGDKEVKLICDVLLKGNNILKKLLLGENQIGDKGAQYIFEALKENKTLKELYLFRNKIGDNGLNYVSEALKDNNTLEKLILGGNQIGDNGAKYIFEALKGNKTLKELNLSRNKISKIGGKFILEELQNNSSLTELHLFHNEIGDELMKEINCKIGITLFI